MCRGEGAHWAPPLPSTFLWVAEGSWAKLRLGEELNRGPLAPQGMTSGLGHLSPYSPGHPPGGRGPLQPAGQQSRSNPRSDCECSGLPVGGHLAMGSSMSFLAGQVPCPKLWAFPPIGNILFLSSMCPSSGTPFLILKACPDTPWELPLQATTWLHNPRNARDRAAARRFPRVSAGQHGLNWRA